MSIFSFNNLSFGNPAAGNAHKIQKYKSSWLTWAANDASSVSLDSSVFGGNEPDRVWLEVLLTSAAGSFSAGTILKFFGYIAYDDATAAARNYGVTIGVNSTFTAITYHIGQDGLMLMSGSGSNGFASIPAASSKIRICAERTVAGDQPDITRVGLVPLERKVVASGAADVQFNLQQYFNEYEDFTISWKSVRTSTDGQFLQIRTSADGTTFDTGVSDYAYVYEGYIQTGGAQGTNGTSAGLFLTVSTTGTADNNEVSNGSVDIFDADNPSFSTRFLSQNGGFNSSSQIYTGSCFGVRQSHEQTLAVAIVAASGNLERGTFILYGKRKVA